MQDIIIERGIKSFIFLFLLLSLPTKAQDRFRVMFYNTENFFDRTHDSLKNDYEFLPNSMHHWTRDRVYQKALHIAQTIAAVGEMTPPALIGLCEVENDSCMYYLLHRSPLRQMDYQYVMTHSADERGIDVALLYQRGMFSLLQKDSIRPHFPWKSFRPTRDILHVSGLVITGDTLDVFICHPPSRMGGLKASEQARMYVAALLHNYADSLMSCRQHPQILIMGDFNDYPDSKSVNEVLDAKEPSDSIAPHRLYDLMTDKIKNKSFGTYKYHGEWNILDQIIVSGSLLLPQAAMHTSKADAHIANCPFLLEKDEKYFGIKPFRTFYGMKYQNGYSDHLPVYADFRLLF